MASCAYCNATIFFGGKKQRDLSFCNTECQRRSFLTSLAQQIPDEQVDQFVREVHEGPCPRCDGRGPIDVHTSYRVWSAVLMTQWSSRPLVCCRACGVKKAIGDTLFSALVGWWGLPLGLVMTPVQVIRNLISLVRSPDLTRPTPALRQALRYQLAASLVDQS